MITITIERGTGDDGYGTEVLSDAALTSLLDGLHDTYPAVTIAVVPGNRSADWPRLTDSARPSWDYLNDEYRAIVIDVRARIKATIKAERPGPEPGQVRTTREHARLISELIYDISTFSDTWDRALLIARYSNLFGTQVTFLAQDPITVRIAEWPAIIDEALSALRAADHSY